MEDATGEFHGARAVMLDSLLAPQIEGNSGGRFFRGNHENDFLKILERTLILLFSTGFILLKF